MFANLRWMDSTSLYRAAVILMVHGFFTLAASSIQEYSDNNEISQLIDELKRAQLNKEYDINRDNSHEVNTLSDILQYSTPDVTSATADDENVASYEPIGNNKNKRGWEEIQRNWRSHFPKRAWEVVRSYWRSPRFRNAYKNYIGKRSDENLVEVPVQPENQDDVWMIDELGYNVDNNANIVPDVYGAKDDIATEDEKDSIFQPESDRGKRGWEDVPIYSFNRLGKRGWEDIQLIPINRFGRSGWENIPIHSLNNLGKRGWEDVRLFPTNRLGKRGWEDIRVFPNEQIQKRGWEELNLFPRFHFGKRDRYIIPPLPNYRPKRGWEEIPMYFGNRIGKRGWEDVRLFPRWRMGQKQTLKRGWEDVGYFQQGRLGKRGWEDVRLFANGDK